MPLWTPNLIATDLWIDISDGDTLTLEGTAITQADDLSGNDRHATRSSTTRPTLSAAAQNGLAMASFDGSTQYFDITNGISVTSSMTVFSVFRRASSGSLTQLTGGTTAGGPPFSLQWFTDNVRYSALGSSGFNTHGTASTVTGTFIESLRRNSTEVQLWIDGAAVGTAQTALGLSSATLSYIGRRAANYNNGLIGELIIISSALSDADREKIEGYLAHKWGLTGGLPVAHPYKTDAPISGVISGVIRDENGDLAADVVVRAYRRDTGALLGEVLSGDGTEEVAGDPYYANVVLLLHCDGTDGSTTFTDSSGTPKTVTASGNAHIEVDQSKVGGASAQFDGVNDYVFAATSTDFYLSGAFALEAWIYPTAFGNFKTIMGNWLSGTGYAFIFGLNSSGNLVLLANNSATPRVISSGTLTTNAWAHVAVTRNNDDDLTLYINGTADGTATGYATDIGPSGGMVLYVGAADSSNHEFSGYIDELRVTNGDVRYSGNFTAPTAALIDFATIPAKPLGEYSLTTSYTDEVNVIALDPSGGDTFNDLILRTTPV